MIAFGYLIPGSRVQPATEKKTKDKIKKIKEFGSLGVKEWIEQKNERMDVIPEDPVRSFVDIHILYLFGRRRSRLLLWCRLLNRLLRQLLRECLALFGRDVLYYG